MEAALTLSTRYANDRVQFDRPIARFQAIQQQLALLAKQAAAASVAVESAAIAVPVYRPSAALALAAAKSASGRPPVRSPRSRIRCTARSAPRTSTACTARLGGFGRRATSAAPKATGRPRSAAG